MVHSDQHQPFSSIRYSSYPDRQKAAEGFLPDHALVKIFSGRLSLYTTSGSTEFPAGALLLIPKNQLFKVTVCPADGGDFSAVTVYFGQSLLQDFVRENQIHSPAPPTAIQQTMLLASSPLYESYISSLAAYQDGTVNQGLTALKLKEALLLMMHLDPEAGSLLFNFTDPVKADLSCYMQAHFRFNVTIDKFAYLTGRSLATFKRDFIKIFGLSPQRWLQQRRLKEAHYLIREKRMKISEVYPEVGFEDLSHFSFAFKKLYGKAPTLI